jgi:hypothetical protein
MLSSSEIYAGCVHAALSGRARSGAGDPSLTEAADARLRWSVERRRRADRRRQGDPHGRRPAAVEERGVRDDNWKAARLRHRDQRPWRTDPKQDLLSVKHWTHLRKKVNALGLAARGAVQERPGCPVPGCCLMLHGVEGLFLLDRRGGVRGRERMLDPLCEIE